jgi:hypothetical protein
MKGFEDVNVEVQDQPDASDRGSSTGSGAT